jgi:hypothetical protein
MFAGMMWLDDDKGRPVEEKVRQAVAHYREKYGQQPELCLVNEGLVVDEMFVDDIAVRPVGHVLQHHFWVGVELSAEGH